MLLGGELIGGIAGTRWLLRAAVGAEATAVLDVLGTTLTGIHVDRLSARV
jgi:hypothetical protein